MGIRNDDDWDLLTLPHTNVNNGIFEQVFVREDQRLMLLDSLTVNVSSEEIDKTASIALLEVPSLVLLDLRA